MNACTSWRRLLASGSISFALAAGYALAQTSVDEESPWPRVRSTNGHTVTLHQPQVESWTSNSFNARAAVGLKLAGAKSELLGVVWLAAHGNVDRSNRIVTLDRFEITKARFPDAPDGGSNALAILRDVVPAGARTVSLDYLITALGFTQAAARQGPRGLKHDPPEIVWATNRTVLVLVHGEPVLKPVPDTEVQRVVNTPALILFDPAGNRFYLNGDGHWFSAATIQGSWSLAQTVPDAVAALAPDASNAASSRSDGIMPRVIVRTRPAELVATGGLPDFRPIRGTALQYAADTDSQLFFHTSSREAYLLLSGRWFKAKSLSGPWTYVAPGDLPADFAKIPPGSAQAVALASVPGTRQAELALLANSVPTTATVNRREAKIELTYDGEPKFKPIDGTKLSYAINAQLPVILASSNYYALDNGVWFTATAATGPWQVATEVPEEIYTIPPSSPVYYATFASVLQSNDDEVEVGYTPGYQGAYEEDGTVVYGTGWDYEPWYGNDYYDWGWSWGYSYWYVPWYQWWVWREWWDQPGALRSALIENIYDRWQGRNGVIHHDRAAKAAGQPRASAFNGYPALYGRFRGATRPAALSPPANTVALNPYSRPQTAVRPGEVPRGAQLLTTLRQSPGGGRDIYASPDGGVYLRKTDGWYRRQGGGWNFVAPTQGQMTPGFGGEYANGVYRPTDASIYKPGSPYKSGSAYKTGSSAAYKPDSSTAYKTDSSSVYKPGADPVYSPNASSAYKSGRAGVPDSGYQAQAQQMAALEREYYARSLSQFRAQNWGGYRARPTRGAIRRR